MRRHALRSLIALAAVGLFAFGAACSSGDDDDEPQFTGDATLSANAVPFTAGPVSGSAEPGWFPIWLDLQDATTIRPAGTRGETIRQVVERFFNQPSVTHVFYMFFEDTPEFASSMNILRCEPPGADQVVGSPETMLKFYEENNIEARIVGTATYNSTNYDIIKVDLNEGYDTHIVVLRTGSCLTPATLISKAGDRDKVEAFRAALSKLVIDETKMPR